MNKLMASLVFSLSSGMATAGQRLDKIDKDADISFYEKALTETDFSRFITSSEVAVSRCWCQGGCFYGSGDSYHFKKVVDIDCNLDLKAKKERVVKQLMNHYIDVHGIRNVAKILDNVAIKCFETSSQ